MNPFIAFYLSCYQSIQLSFTCQRAYTSIYPSISRKTCLGFIILNRDKTGKKMKTRRIWPPTSQRNLIGWGTWASEEAGSQLHQFPEEETRAFSSDQSILFSGRQVDSFSSTFIRRRRHLEQLIPMQLYPQRAITTWAACWRANSIRVLAAPSKGIVYATLRRRRSQIGRAPLALGAMRMAFGALTLLLILSETLRERWEESVMMFWNCIRVLNIAVWWVKKWMEKLSLSLSLSLTRRISSAAVFCFCIFLFH